jgi:hypothetical protein
MERRTLIQLLASGAAWLGFAPASPFAQAHNLSAADESRLRSLAEVVLPGDLGQARAAVVDDFLRWVRNYREGAEMDHGYGFTRLRRTGPSPAVRYAAQLAALGPAFETLDRGARQRLVETAIAAAKIDRLPPRPSGDHVAVDLMAFYFTSPAANDLAYQTVIGRDQCRGLPGSDLRPEPVESRLWVVSVTTL